MSFPDGRTSQATFTFAHEGWMDQAACTSHNPAWWFWDTDTLLETKHKAVEICNACPVKTACLEYALRTNSVYGVYGGLTENQRRQIKENSDAA